MINSNINKNMFSAIEASLSSPEDILANSYGEVKTHETINYRTFKPERDGLFCARIFGPIRDYECLCGKYKRIKYKGIVCDKCEVMVTLSSVRRERMGHIELVSPIVHPWFFKSQPSKIATALGVAAKELEKVIYYQAYLVIDPGNSTLNRFDILTDAEYARVIDEIGHDSAVFGIGGEGVRQALKSIDIPSEINKLSQQISTTKSISQIKKFEKRLTFLTKFSRSGNKLEWMVLVRIPVLPPELRPLVALNGGNFASSDLNELYRRVINRNNRLYRLIEIGAPDIIMQNERRMLQSSVDDLMLGVKALSRGTNARPLKSLTDVLRGKHGRFRQNLLGKRVDYSGRSVISVGPNLKLHECGLPRIMALELFKPFVFSKLIAYGRVSSIKAAKRFVETGFSDVTEILEEVVKDKLVLLNRAPTLHRLGIQAFYPKLIESKAIQLHPLVCKAFNADFDGDQMAVHVPISIESQIEARVLMLSSNNILSPSDGSTIVSPTKDVVLGLYYATSIFTNCAEREVLFSDLGELKAALESKQITYQSKIKFAFRKDGNKIEIVETCPGRILIFAIAYPDLKGDFSIFNEKFTAKHISRVNSALFDILGQKAVANFCDEVMRLGFKICTTSGISFGKDDVKIPEIKYELIQKSMKVVEDAYRQFSSGYITTKERYNKVTDEWSRCTDVVTKEMMSQMAMNSDSEGVNSIHLMVASGARGSEAQLKQMAAMRGLMVKPSGEVMENPVISNFKEGLNVIEYFNSTHGSRKGVADTALRTADAGYLTRRLVDVAQDCIVSEHDCGTNEHLVFKAGITNGKIVEKLGDFLMGRVVAKDVFVGSRKVISSGDIISTSNVDIVNSMPSIAVRSPSKCESKEGICAMCYGIDISKRRLVAVGEPVGVIAAQAIGEPGTQLTLRTFQVGGVSSRASSKQIFADFQGVVEFSNLKYVKSKSGTVTSVNENGKIFIKDAKSDVVLADYILPRGASLFVKSGDTVELGAKIAAWDSYITPVFAECDGYIKFLDMVSGVSYREKIDETTGVSNKIILNYVNRGKYLLPRIAIVDASGKPIKSTDGHELFYILPIGSVISVNDGDKVEAGDNIARIQKDVYAIQDITGGLPIVEGIFEARVPQKPAIVAPFDGYIKIDTSARLKVRMEVVPIEKSLEPVEFFVKKDKFIRVDNGAYVASGDMLVDGDIDPHDILRSQGVDALVHVILDGIQSVYKLQGVKIDNKHIEIIIRKMISRVVVTDAGDSMFIKGEILNIEKVRNINFDLEAAGLKPIKYALTLTGVTKVSVNTDSFISSAAFQEVVKVLSSAAVFGYKDDLRGCKESMIVGRLVPLGTGYNVSKIISSVKTDEVTTNA